MKRVVTGKTPVIHHTDYVDPTFSEAVIAWQRQHGRHALPWQNTQDAYRVWLSEIMLQQTQVSAVIPYYQRFLARFPDVQSLAQAPSEDVMSHWSGLGYYTRARNLHRCAQRVVAEYGGRFPEDPEKLADLPGIGRSTAAAIAAFSYGVRAAILDGNVKRVFARVFGVEGFPGAKAVEDQLWLRAVALLPETGIQSYTQGLMDLGATLCTRTKPACERCPLAARCVALHTQRVSVLPERKPKKKVPEKDTVMLVVRHGNTVLLEQRPDTGIWGGLLSLPEMPVCDPDDTLRELDRALHAFGQVRRYSQLQPFTHVFTHFKLHITPLLVELDDVVAQPATPYVWYAQNKLATAPLPVPAKKLLSGVLLQDDLLSA
jgi:A/G-specific adenine glycosylase